MPSGPAHRLPTTTSVGGPHRRGHRGRGATAVLATAVLSGLLVFAPMPHVASATELQVRTEHVGLQRRAVSRDREPLAAGLATAVDGSTLRAALDAPRGRRATRRSAPTFHAIGVSTMAAPREPVLVRARVSGTWTPWTELEFEPGEAPDAGRETASVGSGVHSEPVWLGDADAYELDAPEAIGDLDVHLVGDGPAQRSVELSAPTAGAAGAPAILPRSAWGASPPTERPTVSLDLKLAVVHHSVNSNSYTASQVPELLRSVQAYHQGVQGWDDFAYNFAVDRFGRVWEGRAGGVDQVVLGGHAQGFNTGTTGVVVLGDFRSSAVPAASLEAVAKVIAWKFALHRVDPVSTTPFVSAGSRKYAADTTVTLPRVVGHRDVQSTDCPGGALYNRLGTIRARVAQLVPAYQQGLAPQLLATDSTGDGRLEPIEYRPGPSGDGQWAVDTAGLLSRATRSIVGAYRPAVGDFDGNGRTDVLWHGSGSTGDPMWWAGPAGYRTQYIPVGGSYVPVVGDFDGNGVDDIFWYATGLASDYVWYFRSDRTRVSVPVRQDLISGIPLVGDFDGSGTDDIFFYGPGTADDTLWRGTGQRWTVTKPAVRGWYDPIVGDATGEGRDDILWFSPGHTTSYRWEFNANGTATSRSLSTDALVGRPVPGDFDGDGLDDALIVSAGAGADQVWYSTPTGIDARPVVVAGSYATAAGAMDAATLPPATDDVLFVSDIGTAYLWSGLTSRLFTSSSG